MFTLTQRPESSIQYDDRLLELNMAFDNIIRMFNMFENDLFNSYEKIIGALDMLVINSKDIQAADFDELHDLFTFIMKEFLDIDIDNQEEEEKQKKIMDFKKDAGLIYASFLSEYNIDLHEQLGKLHWETFSILLTSLGDSTAFKQVVSYRTMKIPSEKEASKEYREHIKKMKNIYGLEDEVDKQDQLEDTLDSIANTFKGGGK